MVSGIILAGGSSTRYGTGENKTLVELLGRPVLEYSLRVFLAADVVDEVVLAAKAGEEAALRKLAEGLCLQKPVTVVTGGADRAASVEKALAAARGEVVLIQDGARPLVTERMLEDCLAALEEADGATIATPSRDTVKLADEEGYAEATTDRSRTWLIQTPQAFYREKLLALHRALGFHVAARFHDAGWKDGAWHDVTWFEREIAPHDGAPKPLRPIGEVGADEVLHVCEQAICERFAK